MAAKKLFTQIFIYFSKPLRLLYSLIIYEIVNFSFFALYSLLLLSFFLYLKSVPIYVIVHVYCIWDIFICITAYLMYMYTILSQIFCFFFLGGISIRSNIRAVLNITEAVLWYRIPPSCLYSWSSLRICR